MGLRKTLFSPVLICLSFPALAGDFTLSSGADYSRGDYGEAVTSETWYVPVIGKYESGALTYKLTVPWLRITNPSVGPDGVPLAGDCDRIESGLGDTVASVDYAVLEGGDGGTLLVDLVGKVKLPTGDEDHCLGTGKTDFSGQIDVTQGLGPVTGFATLGWKKFGDPDNTDFRDPLFASLGLVTRLAPATSIGLAYDWREKVVSEGDEIQELTLFLTQRLSPEWRVQLYALAGFSDASPDSGGGLLLSRRF
ncbi:hypothetical protein [Metapseudomonas furukawaii]